MRVLIAADEHRVPTSVEGALREDGYSTETSRYRGAGAGARQRRPVRPAHPGRQASRDGGPRAGPSSPNGRRAAAGGDPHRRQSRRPRSSGRRRRSTTFWWRPSVARSFSSAPAACSATRRRRTLLRAGGVTLDLRTRRATSGDRTVELTTREFTLLERGHRANPQVMVEGNRR